MTPRLRKFALTAHITVSVGWLGAALAYLALAVGGLTRHDAETVRAAFLAMGLVGWFVIVPLALASLLTGFVQSLGTEWGLFRHYWILAKLLLTSVGTVILLVHMPTVSRTSSAVSEVVHAGGGLLVLAATTALSVYKPWGMTRYGRRRQNERRESRTNSPPALPATRPGGHVHKPITPSQPDDDGAGPAPGSTPGVPRWVKASGVVIVVVLILLLVLLHLTGHLPHGR